MACVAEIDYRMRQWPICPMMSIICRWPGDARSQSVSSEVLNKFARNFPASAPEWCTHCNLVALYGEIEIGKYWLRSWLVAWRHQADTWIRALSCNIDLTLSHSFQPMAVQLSEKAPLPLAKSLAAAWCRRSNTVPSIHCTLVRFRGIHLRVISQTSLATDEPRPPTS